MSREDEIILVLQNLLSKANVAISNNMYSKRELEVINSSKKIIRLSKEFEKYITELESLKDDK